jgi:5,10-methylenetetrahydromethanopterin reductase
MEFWLHGFPTVGTTAGQAAIAEQRGFTGMLLADSQILVADPYVELALSARKTTRLGLGVGITNPITRHPSVTAAAIGSLHAESGGRAMLGIGRGDSALRQIGQRPASVAQLESALRQIQGYLGGAVDGGSRPLAWLPADLPKLPVDVAATGPRVIALAAVLADRVTFNLGADVGRLSWAVSVARQARVDAGLDPSAVALGAYVDLACDPDIERAARMVRGSASIFVNILAEGSASGVPVDDQDRDLADRVAAAYQEAAHGKVNAPQSAAELLPTAFLDRFALIGPADAIAHRVDEYARVGLDHLVVVPGSRDADPVAADASTTLFAESVLRRHGSVSALPVSSWRETVETKQE